MLTLDDLCRLMATSGRKLTPRAARDWISKGLLPRPERYWYRQGSGAFWTGRRVLEQAQTAYDLLKWCKDARTTVLGLWLLGYPIELRFVRAAYREYVTSQFERLGAQFGQPLDLAVGELAGYLADKVAITIAAPPDVRNAISDLLSELLPVYCGNDDDW